MALRNSNLQQQVLMMKAEERSDSRRQGGLIWSRCWAQVQRAWSPLVRVDCQVLDASGPLIAMYIYTRDGSCGVTACTKN
eukprot:1157345-Pelagomonas_calceolata.AAC.11